MNRTRVILAVVGIVVLGAGVGVAAFTGVLPGTGGGSAPEGAPPSATAAGPTDNATFAHDVVTVSRCGQVCRLMNTTTTNSMDETAVNVTLHVQVYADGEGIWQGRTPVGDLAPGESANSTTRIEVGLRGARAIQQNGGNVTVVTNVRANNGNQTFQTQSNVN
jgi:hypothetical protein